MAALTEATARRYKGIENASVTNMEVNTGATIYEGALVGISSGKAVAATTATVIAGICFVDGGTAGDLIDVFSGMEVELPLTGVTASALGATAYAANDYEATLSSNTAILGRIMHVDADNAIVRVRLDMQTVN